MVPHGEHRGGRQTMKGAFSWWSCCCLRFDPVEGVLPCGYEWLKMFTLLYMSHIKKMYTVYLHETCNNDQINHIWHICFTPLNLTRRLTWISFRFYCCYSDSRYSGGVMVTSSLQPILLEKTMDMCCTQPKTQPIFDKWMGDLNIWRKKIVVWSCTSVTVLGTKGPRNQSSSDFHTRAIRSGLCTVNLCPIRKEKETPAY